MGSTHPGLRGLTSSGSRCAVDAYMYPGSITHTPPSRVRHMAMCRKLAGTTCTQRKFPHSDGPLPAHAHPFPFHFVAYSVNKTHGQLPACLGYIPRPVEAPAARWHGSCMCSAQHPWPEIRTLDSESPRTGDWRVVHGTARGLQRMYIAANRRSAHGHLGGTRQQCQLQSAHAGCCGC